jgi:hypothetical protein
VRIFRRCAGGFDRGCGERRSSNLNPVGLEPIGNPLSELLGFAHDAAIRDGDLRSGLRASGQGLGATSGGGKGGSGSFSVIFHDRIISFSSPGLPGEKKYALSRG